MLRKQNMVKKFNVKKIDSPSNPNQFIVLSVLQKFILLFIV